MSAPAAAPTKAPAPTKGRRLLIAAPSLILISAGLTWQEGLQIKHFQQIGKERENKRSDGSSNETRQPVPPGSVSEDWFSTEKWLKEHSPCFYMENVCQSSFRFFYDDVGPDSQSWQPRWQLQLKGGNKQVGPGYPTVIQPMRNSTNESLPLCRGGKIPYSPIPNHMVLYSYFNDMLGEFYARSLTGLLALRWKLGGPGATWDEQTQLYLHLSPKKGMLDSHHIFLEPFTANPLLPFRALFDRASCRCMRRLFLCGFDVQKVNDTAVLTPGGSVWQATDSGDFQKSTIYPHLRNHLYRTVIENNSVLENLVNGFRVRALQKLGLGDETVNHADWLIVGLSQRNLRRTWLDFEATLQECNKRLNPRGVACIEVNVEVETSNPVMHVIMHRALDMVIGVHGAQLTDAIWMKDNSTVLELLPYVPEGIRMGVWTRWITHPTPLGIIFTESNLYHVGYRLGPASAPVCKDFIGNYTGMIECLRGNRWDGRDFAVDIDVVETAVLNFLVNEDRTDCSALRQAANEPHVYVLYNVLCSEKGEDSMRVHHFYHKSEDYK